MGLMSRLSSMLTVTPPMGERAYLPPPMAAMDNYWPYVNFGSGSYPLGGLVQTLQGTREDIVPSFEGYASGAYAGNGIVFACLNARLALFKQATFMYQHLKSGTPGDLWSSPDLDILRVPWENGTTGDLLARMIQDADLGGNSLMLRRPDRIVRLRPDWTSIVHGSPNDANVGMWDPDAVLLGYAYQPGGPIGGAKHRYFLPDEVAHFAPIPDPLAPARGMSWLTPLVREVEGDSAATAHKLAYFRNGATPNLVVTGVPGATPALFSEWVDKFAQGHDSVRNAYKTMYLSAATDAKVVGNDLAQIDFKVVQGAGETRIAAAAGVPPIVVGLSEGLQGSSLNAGNYAAAMRRFADLTGRSLWQDASGALATIVRRQPGSVLVVDDRFIPALKDDVRDHAEVQAKQATAIRTYIDAGFEADSAVKAVNSGDITRLVHTGLFSVQLQAPGSTKMPQGEAPGELPVGGTGDAPEVPAAIPAKPGAAPMTTKPNGGAPK